ncbi:hypothetical protein TCAL_13645 [Tigriopus californicus]|uniref:BACK domain-containing protein n=1 Tax=Tigriopus californicus TaxID=6832 RepID=A0A553PTT2_TIGCA|nr:hypothetical protein TCAL_13645 [Tigriopus californicus]
MVLLQGKPLLIGGCDSNDMTCPPLAKVEVYEESTKQWLYKASLPQPIRSFAAIVVDNGTKVIVAGGRLSSSTTDMVTSFQLLNNAWTILNSAPNPICYQLGTRVTLPDTRDGFLMVGGFLDGAFTLSVKAFFMDLETMSWESLSAFDTIGNTMHGGDMFYLEGQVFAIPYYEGGIWQDASRILSRDMTDSNAQWISHNMSAKAKGKERTEQSKMLCHAGNFNHNI